MWRNFADDKLALVQVAVQHQAITSVSVDPELCHQMALLSHNELKK